jgi:Sec23-binding domain of Sec16
VDLRATLQLLVDGQKEEAARDAAQNGCFAISLILASLCGPRVFEQAIANYAHAELAAGSPLYTAAVLFSGQVKPIRSVWGGDVLALRTTWHYHLLVILGVRSKGWDRFAVSLGDALSSIGESEAAHVCYLVCGCPLASPARKECRYTLLGLDVASADMALTSERAAWAYEITEAYEWTRQRSNPGGSIDCLQPFKLAYAMLLADFGYETAAAKYLKAVSSEYSSTHGLDQSGPQEPLSFAILSCDKKSVSTALAAFASRLTKGVEYEARDHTAKSSAVRHSKASNSQAKMKTSSALLYANGTTVQARENALPNGPTSTELKHDLRAPPMHPALSSENGTGSHQHPELSDQSPPVALPPRPKSPEARPSTSAPPPFASTPKSVGSNVTSSFETPSVSKSPGDDPSQKATKPKSAPMSAPANLQQSASTPASSGKSTYCMDCRNASVRFGLTGMRLRCSRVEKGFFSFGIRDKMTKWLNPDATQADLGEGMQAYYDEKRKVWVFPGEDPEEVSKPIGPPPTTPAPQAASSAGAPSGGGPVASNSSTSPAPPAANDPLAALMALPNRAPSSFQNKSKSMGAIPPGSSGRLLPPPGMIMMPPGAAPGGGEVSSAKGGAPNAAPVTVMMPPQFAVFTPGPAPATSS